MIQNLPKESTIISDTESEDILEQPVIVTDYDGSGGIGLIGYDGHHVFMSYRMVKEVCKVMTQYAQPKEKKKK